MYGGCRTRQVRRRAARTRALARRLRLALAIACALAAARAQAWYEPARDSIRVDLLAPRGEVAGAPERVAWRSSRPIEAVQIEWRPADGGGATRRRIELARAAAAGTFALTNDERTAIASGGRGAWRLIALAGDGEWLAESRAPLVIETSRPK